MVQFFARYMKTKNHFDHEGEGCGNCAKSNEGPAKLAAKKKVSGEPAPKGCNIPFRDK